MEDVCCSVLHCGMGVCCSVLQCVAVQYIAVCCSVLQCVAACLPVLCTSCVTNGRVLRADVDAVPL